MSDKWWNGLTPGGIHYTLNRQIQIRDDRIEELEKENFTLAATQCPFPDGEGLTGSTSGHAYCSKDVELEGCDEYIQSLIKTIDESDASIVSLEVECDNLTLELKRTKAKLEEALEMALDECGYLWRSESYNNWWQERRNRVAQLKGEK